MMKSSKHACNRIYPRGYVARIYLFLYQICPYMPKYALLYAQISNNVVIYQYQQD